MADRYIHVIFLIIRFRDGEQSSNWPTLDNIKCIVNQTPFDVLGATEMFFDLSAYAFKLYNLRIRQRLLILPLPLNLLLFRTAIFQSINSQFLGGYFLIDNLAVTHFIDIRIHQARNHGLTKSEAGIK